MGIKANIARIFSANLLTMISGILIGFIVPAVLTLDSYSYLKTYLLYIGYIGFLHLGFIDGMYIKYGGKDKEEIDKNIFKAEHNIFIMMQIISTFIFILISIIKKDLIIGLFAISILPINTSSFHKLFYQSTGQFKKFARVSYMYTVVYLAINMIGAYILKTNNYIYYCFASLGGHLLVFIVLEVRIFRDLKEIKAKYSKEILNNIKVGFIILIANLGLVIFNATDLWFVKLNLTKEDFAYYSFAVSMLNVINTMIMSVAITFYNFLAKGENKELVIKLKQYFIIVGAFLSSSFFIFSMIINLFIGKYIPSLEIISISFAAFPYIIVIKGLFVNLYRARKDEKKYLKVMIMMVVIAILYNLISIIMFKTIRSIAIATLFAFITWYIYSSYDFKYTRIEKKEIIYLTAILVGFLIISNNMNWFIGGITYVIYYILITFNIYKEEINYKKLKLFFKSSKKVKEYSKV